MMDVGDTTMEDALEWVRQEELSPQDLEFLEARLPALVENLGTIDAWLQERLENWTWDRLARVDRNVLRLGAYEMLIAKDPPFPACVSEAVELAKEFGDDKSGSFVNGILDALWRAKKS